jgi:hypothetical protein
VIVVRVIDRARMAAPTDLKPPPMSWLWVVKS